MNSNRQLNENTFSELPSKRKGLKIYFIAKITTVSYQIDFSDRNPFRNILICKTLAPMVVHFVLRKDPISLILAITSSGLLM